MQDESVGARYAGALFELARDQGSLEEVAQQLELLQAALRSAPSIAHALQSPSIPGPVKKDIVLRALQPSLSPLVLHFILLLVERQRFDAMSSIVEQYGVRLQESRGEITAEVEVALDLGAAVQAAVAERLTAHTGRRAVLQWRTNQDILGGVVVRIKDRIIDYSLRKQLHDLKDRLLQAT
jgi:F-type H+-transporting ATPase subunit delta